MNNKDLLARLDEWLKTPGEEFDDGAYLPNEEVCLAARSYLEKNNAIQWDSITPDGSYGICFESKEIDHRLGNLLIMEFLRDGTIDFFEFNNCKTILKLTGKWKNV